MRAPQRAAAPVCYAGNQILLTSTDAWAYLILPPVSWAFLSDKENEQQVLSSASAFTNLRTPSADLDGREAMLEAFRTVKLTTKLPPVAELHIRTVCKRHSPQDWAARLSTGTPAPGYGRHLARVLDVISGKQYWEKITFLGVRLGTRSTREKIPVFPEAAEITEWAGRAREIGVALGASELRARDATTTELAWLIRHTTSGSALDLVPLPDLDAYGPEDVAALMDATVTTGRALTQITAAGAEEYRTVLTFAEFPKTMTYPDGGPPWASLSDWAATPAFPVEYSARLMLIDPQQTQKDVRNKLIGVDEETEHIAGAGARIPLALRERADDAQMLQHALSQQGNPLAYATHRLIVAAPDADLCLARARTIIRHYNRDGIKLKRLNWDQRTLHHESLPGGRPRGKLHVQHQPVTTIAGGMPQAAETLGDTVGPYLGTAKTQAESPVFWSPFEAARRNNPTVAAILGKVGGGKSYLTARICLDSAVTADATVVVLDPIKKEMRQMAPLVQAAGLPVSVIAIDEDHPGLLDPFGFGGSQGEKTLRAAETLLLLLPDTVGDAEKASRQGAILRAVEAVAVSPEPSMSKVITWLADEAVRRKADGDSSRVEENLATELKVLSRMPLGSLCFAAADTEPLNIMGQTTILTFSGLDLPAASTPPGAYRMAERLSVGIYYLATEYIKQLFAADRRIKKLLVIDEAWALTRTPQGQSLIEAMSRMGRSHNIAMLLASHNVQDLMDERITGCISTVFAVKSTADEEIRAVFGQLGIEDITRNRNWLNELKTGEVIMRDMDGRVGIVRIDDGGPDFHDEMNTNPTELREDTTELETVVVA